MGKHTITLNQRGDAPTVHPNVYGHFAEHLGRCIYEGIWVGEDSDIPNVRGIRKDVVEALKAIHIPVLRWPGGCFADEYHWKDGIGPRDTRPSIYNSHWGGVVENNHFGTHEFMDLCGQLGCAPYVCGNVGSGTVQEMSEWVEYMTSAASSPMADLRRKNGRGEPWHLPFFGVGNESWGCGGHMRPEYYADLYRRYNTYVRTYGPHRIERIACGPNPADYRWTEVMMEQAAAHMDGLALHNYTLLGGKWPPSGRAADFTDEEYWSTIDAARKMDDLISAHSGIMAKYDPEARVSLVVDEWGTWHEVEAGTNPGFLFQQNSMRDALVAAVHFEAFHRHAARVRMANIAQTVNVLQAMVLTEGPKMVLTPTYWVFKLYAPHQGGRLVDLQGNSDELVATATVKDEVLTVSIANLSLDLAVEVHMKGLGTPHVIEGETLFSTSARSHNTFADSNCIAPRHLATKAQAASLSVELAPASVSTIRVRVG